MKKLLISLVIILIIVSYTYSKTLKVFSKRQIESLHPYHRPMENPNLIKDLNFINSFIFDTVCRYTQKKTGNYSFSYNERILQKNDGESSDDIYAFKINEDTRFADSRYLEAKDIKYTWEVIKANKDRNLELFGKLDFCIRKIELHRKDKFKFYIYTNTFITETELMYALSGMFIIPHKYYGGELDTKIENKGIIKKAKSFYNLPIGTGPFYCHMNKPSKTEVILKRNIHFNFPDSCNITKVNIVNNNLEDTALLKEIANYHIVIGLPSVYYKDIDDMYDNLHDLKFDHGNSFILLMNSEIPEHQRKILVKIFNYNDCELKKDMYGHLFDKKNFLFGEAVPHYEKIVKYSIFHDIYYNNTYFKNNKAFKNLHASKDVNINEEVINFQDKELIIYAASSQFKENIKSFLNTKYEKIGWKKTIKGKFDINTLNYVSFFNKIRSGDFDIALLEASAIDNDYKYYFHNSYIPGDENRLDLKMNFAKYQNQEFDRRLSNLSGDLYSINKQYEIHKFIYNELYPAVFLFESDKRYFCPNKNYKINYLNLQPSGIQDNIEICSVKNSIINSLIPILVVIIIILLIITYIHNKAKNKEKRRSLAKRTKHEGNISTNVNDDMESNTSISSDTKEESNEKS